MNGRMRTVEQTPAGFRPLSMRLGLIAAADESPDPRMLAGLATRHGAVLFPSLCADVGDFRAWTEAIGGQYLAYQGGAVRRPGSDDGTLVLVNLPGDNDGSTLHGEQYYLSRPPRWLWFYCELPAQEGGATLLCDGTALFAALPEAVARQFAERTVCYRRSLSPETWAAVFGGGAAPPEGWRVSKGRDGWIRAEYECAAVVPAPNGRPAFINSVLITARDFGDPDASPGQRVEVVWGDGRALEPGLVDLVLEHAERVQVELMLQAKDVLLVDNRWIMHGRRPFQGARRVYSRMAARLPDEP